MRCPKSYAQCERVFDASPVLAAWIWHRDDDPQWTIAAIYVVLSLVAFILTGTQTALFGVILMSVAMVIVKRYPNSGLRSSLGRSPPCFPDPLCVVGPDLGILRCHYHNPSSQDPIRGACWPKISSLRSLATMLRHHSLGATHMAIIRNGWRMRVRGTVSNLPGRFTPSSRCTRIIWLCKFGLRQALSGLPWGSFLILPRFKTERRRTGADCEICCGGSDRRLRRDLQFRLQHVE